MSRLPGWSPSIVVIIEVDTAIAIAKPSTRAALMAADASAAFSVSTSIKAYDVAALYTTPLPSPMTARATMTGPSAPSTPTIAMATIPAAITAEESASVRGRGE